MLPRGRLRAHPARNRVPLYGTESPAHWSWYIRGRIEAHVWELCLDCLPCCVQGRSQARDALCWQLHPEQLQLAPAAAGLVSALTEVPIEADGQSLRLTDPPGLITPSITPSSPSCPRFHAFPVNIRGSAAALRVTAASVPRFWTVLCQGCGCTVFCGSCIKAP